jgi:UPF0755 protein
MRTRKLLYILASLLALFLIIFLVFRRILRLELDTKGQKVEVFIPTGSSYTEVYLTLDSLLDITNPELFDLLAKRKKYPERIRPGRYIIEPGMTYISVLDMLRSGRQAPVNVTFNNIRTLQQLAGRIGERLEADSAEIIDFLLDESNYINDGFSKQTVIAVFLPNTYQMYWTTDPKGFYMRMLREYRTFWNPQRVAMAKEKGLEPLEVSTLASIVDEEVSKKDEKPRIAGVYLNRLKLGMPFQADPTVRFALNDFTIARVLRKHLGIDSPYNTYLYKGLPPGPIACPSIDGIEAVLNAEDHDFLYFAAKADFSGYHNFARTLSEHNRNAVLYQRELNKRRIFR